MTQQEKDRLLALLSSQRTWCQEVEARDRRGQAVRYNDASAVAWDLTGAVCHLFGWDRALELFAQLGRHVMGRRPPVGRHSGHPRDPQMASMAALQDFNDRPTTNYETIRGHLAAMPVHHGHAKAILKVTPAAAEHLAHALAQARAGPNMTFRMVQKEDAWSLWMDTMHPDDVVFTHHGNAVLVLEGEVSAVLSTRTLDLEYTPEGPQLAFSPEPEPSYDGLHPPDADSGIVPLNEPPAAGAPTVAPGG